MKGKLIVWTCVLVFVGFCGVRIWNTGIFCCQPQDGERQIISLAAVAEESAQKPADNQGDNSEEVLPDSPEFPELHEGPTEPSESIFSTLSAVNGTEETVTLGALYETCKRTDDPDKYKFQIELTTRGAAINTVTLSEFDNRDPDDPQPFILLKPISASASEEVYSLASRGLRIVEEESETFPAQSFPLQKLNWTLTEHDQNSAVFEALLGQVENKDGQQVLTQPRIRLQKTYRIEPGSYDLTCELTMQNLTGLGVQTNVEVQGTGRMKKEDVRMDGRKVFAAYEMETESIETLALGYSELRGMEQELKCPQDRQGFSLLFYQLGKFIKKVSGSKPPAEALQMKTKKSSAQFVWAATANKYFDAIVRPTEKGTFTFLGAEYLDDDLCSRAAGNQSAGSYLLQSQPVHLSAAGVVGDSQVLSFSVFLGPKDKPLFDKNETYRKYAYFQTFAMRSCCCCPSFITQPLAFGIMWLMTTLYHLMGPWGNYGVVIMFLVFVMRLIMHPITKKSQVTMMKVQKLGPELQEVQKKYKGNPQELQKRMADVYQQHGMTQFSPMVGMFPMLLQMPVWIALWTAVYTSIDLRGAGFLPFWITDLSAPDALIRFGKDGFTVPLIGMHIASLNLLPLLMGVVMYLQQKMMPQSQTPTDSARPELAQQQKIMKIMFPLLFPIMLYNGPSGVNLYIMSSIGAGVIEQYVIRRHLEQQEAEKEKRFVPVTSKTGGKVKKKKPKPFFREYK